jgi:ParG
MKTIAFKVPKKPASPDEWVHGGPEQGTPSAPRMKRLTIDVTPDLHTRLKVECSRRGLKIADVVRDLLEREFPAS